MVSVAAFLFLVTPGVWAEITGEDIMRQQKDLYKSQTESELQKMALVDKGTVTEEREVRRYTKEVEPDVYRTLIAFTDPADIKGTALLVWGHKNQPNDQWLYLPAQGKMQRIAESGKKQYFMGTDFTFEDLQVKDLEAENLENFSYNIIDADTLGGISCYIIEAVPATEEEQAETQYSKRILWVTDEQLLTLQAEFYDRRGDLVKVQTNEGWENVTGTIWRPRKITMKNVKTGHETRIEVLQRAVNEGIDDATFTEDYVLKGSYIF